MVDSLVAASLAASLPEWIGLAIGVAVAWRLTRGGAGTAVGELSESNRVLERRLHELASEVRDLKIENAELRQRTDFGAVIEDHESRAEERSEKILRVLDLIAARLGPEGADANLKRRSD